MARVGASFLRGREEERGRGADREDSDSEQRGNSLQDREDREEAGDSNRRGLQRRRQGLPPRGILRRGHTDRPTPSPPQLPQRPFHCRRSPAFRCPGTYLGPEQNTCLFFFF